MSWLPYSLRHDGARLLVDWCNLGSRRLTTPFFDQSIHQLLQHNPHASRSTPFEELADFNAGNPPRKPNGFIFHMSRCGSTLITQMLAAVPEFTVFSEPAILEALLQNKYQSAEEPSERKRWLLENVIQALVSCKSDSRGAFIKFSARAILDYPLITQVYPSVPSVFVYREPVEVLVSLVGSQTSQLPPGLEKAGLLPNDPQVIKMMQPVEFWGRVIANQCVAALEMSASSPPLLINYNQLPEAVWTKIINFFSNVVLSAADVAQMQKMISRSAKDPAKHFRDDRARKHDSATEEIHAVAERFVRPYYDRLEEIRKESEAPAAG